MSTKLVVLILSILGLAVGGGTALYYGTDLFEPDRPAELAALVPAEPAVLEASVALDALEAAPAEAERDEAELAAPADATIEEAPRADQLEPRLAETIGAAGPFIAEGEVAEAAPPRAMRAWKTSYAMAEEVATAIEEERGASAPAPDVAAAPPRPAHDAPAPRPETAAGFDEVQLAAMADASEPVARPPKAMLAWKTSYAVAEEGATAPEPLDEPEMLPPPPLVAIETVQVEDPGQLHVGGQADPHASVRLYVNGDHLTDARAGEAGAWHATGARELSPGRHLVRADIVDDEGKTLARSEMQFDRIQVVLSEEPAPAAPVAPAAEAPRAADVTEGDIGATRRTMVHIERGDNLWHIARAIYGQGIRYTVIYEANRNQIRNPDLIYPGQTFTVPVLSQSSD